MFGDVGKYFIGNTFGDRNGGLSADIPVSCGDDASAYRGAEPKD